MKVAAKSLLAIAWLTLAMLIFLGSENTLTYAATPVHVAPRANPELHARSMSPIQLPPLGLNGAGWVVQINVTGPRETVFNWSTMKCEDLDIPDLPARAFRDNTGNVQLIATHFINRRMIGTSFSTLTHPCDLIMSSSVNSDPSAYDDYEWLASFYTQDGSNIYALIHNEYHGNEHDPNCTGGYIACWWNAITLASSSNAGMTYTHSSAPSHSLRLFHTPMFRISVRLGCFARAILSQRMAITTRSCYW